jgi:F-type H+-transporting ATPase subunit epsilon
MRECDRITIATREAVVSDDLADLRIEVLTAFRRETDEEKSARMDAQRLYLAAIRQINRFLKSEWTPALQSERIADFTESLEP